MKNEEEKEIKYFSMFTGVGGFELGLESKNNSSNSRERQTKGELSSKREDIIGQWSSQSIINKSKSNALYQCVGGFEL